VPVGPSWKKLLLDIPMVVWTIGLLLRHRYRVVHAHEESVFWCRFLKPLFRFRLIYDMHSSLPQQLENFRFTRSRLLIGTFKALEESCLGAANAVVTICPDLRDYALGAGVAPSRHLLIENSIFDDVRIRSPAEADTVTKLREAPRFGPNDRVILYAGTFEAYQGIELLVRAFLEVSRSCPAARLLLVGGTEEQTRRTQALIESLGLDDRCALTGRVPKSAALAYTRAANVLVSPRVHGTNTPLKIYEQLASGRPLVATRIWSHTQVLDDSVCYLAEPDPQSLASALIAALTDEAGAALRVRNALELYQRNYSREVYERKIRQMLEIVA
jgi:glycosyltransferase involved in cell wall biosynthesis